MSEVATTKMSSRGQVVIPEEVRERLGLEQGAQFVVVGEGDTVVLKAIRAPSMKDFDRLIAEAQKAAKRAGLKKSDVEKAIREGRARR
jgi:AbrB family looped-hinge helix DNA binding protein